jgi:hypothetical protein
LSHPGIGQPQIDPLVLTLSCQVQPPDIVIAAALSFFFLT